MHQISLFKSGALVWLPSNSRRFRWGEGVRQLSLFPQDYSITKVPLIGVLKGYTDRGDCEVLFQDGTPQQRRRNDRISTNQKK